MQIPTRAPRDRSTITTHLTDEKGTGPYTVHVDCILTRRKRHHIVENAQGGVAFRSRWMSDIVEWLASDGETYYFIETARDRYAVSVEPVNKVRRL